MDPTDYTVSRCQIFKEPRWLNYPHDGYRVVRLPEYTNLRRSAQAQEHPDNPGSNFGETAASQSQLTFGVLEYVMQMPVSEDQLLRCDNSGYRYMTTRNTDEMIATWKNHLAEMDPDDRRAILRDARKRLLGIQTSMASDIFISTDAAKGLGDDKLPTMVFICLLGEILTDAVRRLLQELEESSNSDSSPDLSWTPCLGMLFNEQYREAMLQYKWCPLTITQLLSTQNVWSLRYISKINPLPDGKSHNECGSEECKTDQVNEAHYVQRHTECCVSSHSICDNWRPNVNRILDCIQGGEVPVILFVDGQEEADVRRASDVRYVAISHVWADGLGSHSEKGMPVCQLGRLAGLVAEYCPGAAFWVDSLCVPEKPAMRKKAIQMMAETYQRATAVIVLDAGLQIFRYESSSVEATLHLLTSSWMRRLWTLQEAVLAQNIVVAFADRQVELSDLIRDGLESKPFLIVGRISQELHRLGKLSRRGEFPDTRYTIADVSRSLKWRNTSKPSDEAIAIASLLGVDIKLVLEEETPERRMIVLLKHLKRLPKDIIFKAGPKIDQPGFGWAPISLMGAGGGPLGTEANAICTDRGLQGIYMAIEIKRREVQPKIPETRKVYQLAGRRDEDDFPCDMLLIDRPLHLGERVACIAVTTSGRSEAKGLCTADCMYQTKMVITDILLDDWIVEPVVEALWMGILRARIG
uniref:Heterokaryon incompatibility domain-containing protein n=1 Tax=Colletotrichum fructicola (strain Nara gc5) TaxID=1213859 RepID=L2FVB6_COLFN